MLSHPSVGLNPGRDTRYFNILASLHPVYKWVEVDIVYEKAIGAPRQLRAVYSPGAEKH